jgi:hypothetical protein
VNTPRHPPQLKLPQHQEEPSPSELAAARKQQAAKITSSSKLTQSGLRPNEERPSPSELAAAKRKAELKSNLHAKLSNSLEQRKQAEQEFERLTKEKTKRQAENAEAVNKQQQSWDTCPDNWKTVVDENGERVKRPALKALMEQIHKGTFRGVYSSTNVFQERAPAAVLNQGSPNATKSERIASSKEKGAMEAAEKEKENARVENTGLHTRPADWAAYANRSHQTQYATPASSVVPTSAVAVRTSVVQRRVNHSVQTTSSAAPGTSRVQNHPVDMSMAVVRRGDNRFSGPVSPVFPVLQGDDPLEAFEVWAAQNFRH